MGDGRGKGYWASESNSNIWIDYKILHLLLCKITLDDPASLTTNFHNAESIFKLQSGIFKERRHFQCLLISYLWIVSLNLIRCSLNETLAKEILVWNNTVLYWHLIKWLLDFILALLFWVPGYSHGFDTLPVLGNEPF